MEDSIFVVIARPMTEYVTFDDKFTVYDSRIDSDVTVSSPIGSRIRTSKASVQFTVSNTHFKAAVVLHF